MNKGRHMKRHMKRYGIAAIAATVTAIVTALVVALAVRATRPVNERNLMGILLTLPAERFGAPFGLLLPAFSAGL